VLLRAYDDAVENKADVIIVGGDLVQQDSDFEYSYAMRLLAMAPETIPLFNTIGNHEAWDRDNHHEVAQYRKYFGNEESWFETKGVLFVSLDTSDYHFDAERAERAAKVLRERAESARYRVLLSHVLPQVGKLGKKGHEKELSDQESKLILDLVTTYKIDLLLGGHYHGYAEESYGGALMLLTGGGGATLDDKDAGYHYCRVTLGAPPQHVKIDVSSPYGLEWIRYNVLRYPYAVLAPLLVLLVALQLVARRKKK
jgi:3',5'-cyclic AMP phosphodiesterase CpdA